MQKITHYPFLRRALTKILIEGLYLRINNIIYDKLTGIIMGKGENVNFSSKIMYKTSLFISSLLLNMVLEIWDRVFRQDKEIKRIEIGNEKKSNYAYSHSTILYISEVCFVRGLLGTGLHSSGWGVEKRAKLLLYLVMLSITHVIAQTPPPVRSAGIFNYHRALDTTVNCTCRMPGLSTPYESQTPGAESWGWGCASSPGKWLQIDNNISKEVCLHRDHDKSIVLRPVSIPYQ